MRRDANRGHRRRLEHDSAARGGRRRGRSRAARKGKGAPRAGRGDRALRRGLGRQADNAEELVAALTRAAGVQARILTKEEEGTLAYRGAILTAGVPLPSRVAVCDIGGASTEIAVGSPNTEPDWIESVDLGSVRLTARAGDMQAEARAALASLEPPTAETALAVGGSARAARRLVGTVLG